MRRNAGAASFVQIAVIVGLIAPVVVMLCAAAAKFGWMDWKTAFGFVVRPLKPLPFPLPVVVAAVGAVLGLIALFVARADFKRFGVWALLAFLAPAVVVGGYWRFKQIAASVPPIHDVSTDWAEPVMFTKPLMAERAGAPNPVEADPRVPADSKSKWAGRRVAEINAETCPGAKPIMRQLHPDQVADVLEHNGITVMGRAPFRVEGTYESFWWGFKDDVAVRIRPERTDVRSVSRVGQSDLGANCKRVTKLMKDLGELP
jgi:hypothetical protein